MRKQVDGNGTVRCLGKANCHLGVAEQPHLVVGVGRQGCPSEICCAGQESAGTGKNECLILIWVVKSGKDTSSETKKSAYPGSAKRKTPPHRKGEERQLEQCNTKASANRFSMTSASLSTKSVCEEKECLLKSGKDRAALTSSHKKHLFYNLLINNILYLCVT